MYISHGMTPEPNMNRVKRNCSACAMRIAVLCFCLLLNAFASPLVSGQDANAVPPEPSREVSFKGISALVPSRDKTRIYALAERSQEILVLDTANMSTVTTWRLPYATPSGMAISPCGDFLFISAGGAQGILFTVSTEDGSVVKKGASGHTPVAPVAGPDGTRLYVCIRHEARIAEYDVRTLEELRSFPAVREPCALAVAPDGKSLVASNLLPFDRLGPSGEPGTEKNGARITHVDLETGESVHIRLPYGSTGVRGIAISPDGHYAFATSTLGRTDSPATTLERGWMNTNGLSVIDMEKRKLVNTILLDDLDQGAANPWGVVVSPNGKTAYVALAGCHGLCAVDLEKGLEALHGIKVKDEQARLEGYSSDSIITYTNDKPQGIPFSEPFKKRLSLVGKAPRALTVIGSRVFLAMYFSDTINVVDMADQKPKASVYPLGPEPILTPALEGERIWNDANICYRTWQSCATCHPDAGTDALNWDLANDGYSNPKNTKDMLYARATSPAMWHGVRTSADVAIRTGFHHILLVNPPEEVYSRVEAYFDSLPNIPSPRLVNGQLGESAIKGKALFERPDVGCATCHSGEYLADGKLHDVGTRAPRDTRDEFATPTLRGLWRTAPYMHDGRYLEAREIFSEGRHGDSLGGTAVLSDSDLDDLVEYILSI